MHVSNHAPIVLLLAALFQACGGADRVPETGSLSRSQVAPETPTQEPDSADLQALRERMVRLQIEARGVRDPDILRAMRTVPRHRFVPDAPAAQAYGDYPLPIGHGQTISQPFIVAFMADAAGISPEDRVLEIGTGSGYGAAILGELAAEVYTVEILPELANRAAQVLTSLGYENVHVRAGNGWGGWPEHAPYDAIVVTAAPDEIPPALVEQLAPGGMLVIPVGDTLQRLRVFRKTEGGMEEVSSLPVQFVPMVRERPDTAG